MIGWALRFLIGCVALVALLLAMPRTPVSLLAMAFPDAVFWHNTQAREVLLAIDDGPNPETTPAILDALDQAGAKAMFFVFGEKAAANPDLIREIAKRGHGIAAHMYRDEVTFLRNGLEVAYDLDRTLDAIPQDVPVTFVRPGYGVPSPALMDAAKGAGVTVFVGDVTPLDTWGLPPQTYQTYLDFVAQSGSVLTFHDRPDTGAATAESLPRAIERLRGKGFEIVPWSDLRPGP